MNGLRTCRVVVIDDDIDEARPLLTTLNNIGIGTLYFDGDSEKLPKEPLTGIRVLFLDLRLMSSLNPDPRHYIRHTLAVLKKVIDIESCLTGIIYWAKQKEDRDEFNIQLSQNIPQFKPAFLLAIDNKMQFCNSNNSEKLKQVLLNTLRQFPAQKLLWSWEQSVHDAASATCRQLVSVALKDSAGNNNKTNDEKILNLLRSLIVSAGGNADLSPQSLMNCLFESLNLVHLDQLEHCVFGMEKKDLPRKNGLARQLVQRPTLSAEQISRLNGILITSKVPPNKSHMSPGNIYVAKLWNRKDQSFPFDKRTKVFKNFIIDIWPNLKNNNELLDFLIRQSTPCLVDITPACDYASKKVKIARLLGGVFIRSSGDKKKDEKLELKDQCKIFAKEIELCYFQSEALGLNGNYKIVVNARHLYSKPVEDLKKHKAAFRLRRQIVTDIQAWFASHAARPGYLSI
jgi:hypothetical protein